MTFSTYDQYNENEYFIKFLRIHPHLSYADIPYTQKKLEFQLNLLDKFNKKIITKEQLIVLYNKLIKKETKEIDKISDITLKYQNDIKELKKMKDINCINFIDTIC
jgi:hypothetical protein